MQADAAGRVAALYRSDWSLIVATLIRLIGDFDVAEEAAQDALPLPSITGGRPEFPSFRARGSSRPRITKRSTVSAGAPASRRRSTRIPPSLNPRTWIPNTNLTRSRTIVFD
jgi:hypothetical protein